MKQREIKFRAWDEDNHCMINDWYKITEEKITKGRFLGRQAQTLATVFMQFTGLRDKNGKEIFEGDIVKNIDGYLFEVDWSETFACFQLIKIEAGTLWKFRANSTLESSTMEVIGNIYENPELLEESK